MKHIAQLSAIIFLLLMSPVTTWGQNLPGKTDTGHIIKMLEQAKKVHLAGAPDSAMAIFHDNLIKSKKIHYKYGIALSLSGIGGVYAQYGNFEKALSTFHEALAYCDTGNNTQNLIAALYNNIGGIYMIYGDYAQSMENLERAIALHEKFPSTITLEKLYNNLGSVLNQIGLPGKALYYLEKGEALAIKNNKQDILADILINKGVALAKQKQWEESEKVFQEALNIGAANKDRSISHAVYTNMGTIALENDQLKKAIAYLLKAEKIKGNIDPFYENEVPVMLGRAYLKLKNYHEALPYLKKALHTATQLNMTTDLVNVHRLLAQFYSEKGDYQLAFEHQNEEKKWADNLNNKAKLDAVNQIEIKYRTAQMGKEIAEKELMISRQENSIYSRNIWIGVTGIGLLLTLIFAFILYKNNQHKQRLKDEKVINLIRQQELSEIKAVMNGEEQERVRIARNIHDGIMVQFSAVMMNLSALLGQKEEVIKKDTLYPLEQQLDKATGELRKTAHNLMPDMLLEEGIAEAIYYFCNSLRQDIALNIVFDAVGEIPRFEVQAELSIYRIVQELLQNIIKHARATEAIVQLSYENNRLSITIEDNGIGMPAKETGRGLGLKSIRARMLALNGDMEIESSAAGTAIHLALDMD